MQPYQAARRPDSDPDPRPPKSDAWARCLDQAALPGHQANKPYIHRHRPEKWIHISASIGVPIWWWHWNTKDNVCNLEQTLEYRDQVEAKLGLRWWSPSINFMQIRETSTSKAQIQVTKSSKRHKAPGTLNVNQFNSFSLCTKLRYKLLLLQSRKLSV